MTRWSFLMRRITFDNFLRLATSVVGLYLTYRGLQLASSDMHAPSLACFGFGFLFVAFSHMSQFKRFKGFGFEAELWEEKQKEAGQLIDALTKSMVLMSEQLVFTATHIGQFGGPKYKALINLESDIEELLYLAQADRTKIEEILKPIGNSIYILSSIQALRDVKNFLQDSDKDKFAIDFGTQLDRMDKIEKFPVDLIDKIDWLHEREKDDLKKIIDDAIEARAKYRRTANISAAR